MKRRGTFNSIFFDTKRAHFFFFCEPLYAQWARYFFEHRRTNFLELNTPREEHKLKGMRRILKIVLNNLPSFNDLHLFKRLESAARLHWVPIQTSSSYFRNGCAARFFIPTRQFSKLIIFPSNKLSYNFWWIWDHLVP